MESSELVRLVEDTKKQLLHLQALGVEGIQIRQTTQPSADIKPTVRAVPPLVTETAIDHSSSKTKSGPPKGSLFGDIAPTPEKLNPSSETFEQIHSDIGDCTRCPLHRERTTVVHTEGNRKARLMFVGEAPGADEDIQARPFVGRAGQLLTKIIEAIGLKREEVLIGNVNRC